MIDRNKKGQFIKGHQVSNYGKGRFVKGHKNLCLKGKNNHNWKGGKIIKGGYVFILKPNHPSISGYNRYVRKHRLVMEKYLGRYLRPWEYVHHKNGIKTDNRIKNLEIVIAKKHLGQIKCPYCKKEFLIR